MQRAALLLVVLLAIPVAAGAQSRDGLGAGAHPTIFTKRANGTPAGPDYSQVNTREKAQQLVEKGELVPVLLLPQMFGGDRRPENIVFVPQFVAKLKHDVDESTVKPMLMDRRVKRYEAKPIYSGTSLIPIALTIRA